MTKNTRYKGYLSWLFIVSVLFAQHCVAQNKLITLKEALKLAETNYPLAKAKTDYSKAAAYDVKSTRREYLPSLTLHEQLDYGTTNALQGTYFTMGLVPSISAPITTTNQYNPVYGSVSLAMAEWTPYTFGARKAKLDMAKSTYNAMQADEENAKLQYQFATAEAYLNFIVLQRFTRLRALNIQRTTLVLNVVRALSRSGMKSGADSTFALAEASKAKLTFNEAYRNEQSQKILLTQFMGLDSINYAVDTTAVSNNPSMNLPVVKIKAEDHPLALYYKSHIALADAKARYTQRAYWPQLQLLAYSWGRGSGLDPDNGQRYESFNDGISLSRFNYAFGAAITFNIMDYPRIRANYNAELHRQEAITEEYNAGLADIKGKQAISDIQLTTAQQQLAEVPIQLNAAQASFEQIKARYNSGLATLTELTQSLYNLNRAEVDITLAYSGFWKAVLYKAAAVGDISYFTQNIK